MHAARSTDQRPHPSASSGSPSSACLSPQPLLEMQFALVPSRVLAIGVQFEVFSRLADGPRSAADLARDAGASERGMRMLLDSLVAIQLLTKADGRYALSAMAAEYLVKGRPDYVGWMLEHDRTWQTWGRLAEAIRTGRPIQRLEVEDEGAEFFSVLVRSLHVFNREPARRAAAALGVGRSARGLRVLDVACGSGVWGIGVAEADVQARITAHDFAGMLTLTQEYVERHGLSGRFDYLAGDLKTVDFGQARFDLAILGNIVHSEGEESSRALFGRLHRALAPGGRVAIVDMIPNPDRATPPFPVFFALVMLLQTDAGDTYTLPEYTRWLTEAGFADVTTADIGSHSPFIIATRR